MILILSIVIYPVASGISMSFQEMRLTRPDLGEPFVGFKHYIKMFTDDDVFSNALRNTLVWVVVGVTSQFVLGLITALALNRPLPGMRFARVLILLPWIMPSVVAGHMWALMLDSRLGVINDILVKIGILDSYRAWFADPNTAMLTVLAVSLWNSFPFFTLLLLAGLQGIPDDLYEAASVDGANVWHQFRHITLPLLTPVIVAVIILRTIGMVNSPDLLVVLTGGGPGNASQVLSLYAFQKAYTEFNFGYAGAISVFMLTLLMVFTVFYVRLSGVSKE